MPNVALREKPAGNKNNRAATVRYLSQKEGKETLEVNLERKWSYDQRCKDRESVMRREGISTPTHPSYSTGSTLKGIEERLLNTAQTHTHWLKETKEN